MNNFTYRVKTFAKSDKPKNALGCFSVFAFSFFKMYSFIYLAVPSLSCSMWNLQPLLQYVGIFLVVAWELQWQHVGSTSLTRDQAQAPCIGSLES